MTTPKGKGKKTTNKKKEKVNMIKQLADSLGIDFGISQESPLLSEPVVSKPTNSPKGLIGIDMKKVHKDMEHKLHNKSLMKGKGDRVLQGLKEGKKEEWHFVIGYLKITDPLMFNKSCETDDWAAFSPEMSLDKLIGRERKRIVEEIEKMKKSWGGDPPKPGRENSGDASEMYQCGYFDSLDDLLNFLKHYETKD